MNFMNIGSALSSVLNVGLHALPWGSVAAAVLQEIGALPRNATSEQFNHAFDRGFASWKGDPSVPDEHKTLHHFDAALTNAIHQPSFNAQIGHLSPGEVKAALQNWTDGHQAQGEFKAVMEDKGYGAHNTGF